jgi:4-hydroxybenzoate polyprenyltransferase
VLKTLNRYASLIRFEHTIFALPFALSAMLLATPTLWPSLATWVLVVLAMVGGRTYAMGLNRILDRALDAKNPRTQTRELVTGTVKLSEAWALTLGSLVLLIASVSQLPPLCLRLLPIAIAVLTLYSYTKRFTSFCHFVLGLALGISAIGGWVAVTGSLTLPPILFGLAIVFWVAGFDIIYACQDVAFDREQKLHSLPASFGLAKALRFCKLSHALAILVLLLFAWLTGAHASFYSAIALVTAMLIYENSLVSADDLSQVNAAFFNINGLVSLAVFVLVVLNKIAMTR